MSVFNSVLIVKINVQPWLAELYHSTNGLGWKRNDNWLSSKPLKEWYGVTLHKNSLRIRKLNLTDNKLECILFLFLPFLCCHWALHSPTLIHLFRRRGTIPVSLVALLGDGLTELRPSGNKLSGDGSGSSFGCSILESWFLFGWHSFLPSSNRRVADCDGEVHRRKAHGWIYESWN